MPEDVERVTSQKLLKYTGEMAHHYHILIFLLQFSRGTARSVGRHWQKDSAIVVTCVCGSELNSDEAGDDIMVRNMGIN